MSRKEEPARVDLRRNLQFCHWGSKAMTSGIQNKTRGSAAPGRGFASGLASMLVVCLLVLWPASSFAGPRAWGRQGARGGADRSGEACSGTIAGSQGGGKSKWKWKWKRCREFCAEAGLWRKPGSDAAWGE
jgi:hypothetical protein